MAQHSSLITVMEKAARKAAPRLRRDFGEVEQLQVSRKGPSDFVSQADRAAEATIRDVLRQARPEYGFLMEEEGEVAGKEGQPRWIVDPLDGTTNFLHGIPHFAISIAVEYKSEINAGLIYNPITDESFWAEKNAGAWLNMRRLRVSARKDLGDCVIATGIPFQGHGDYAEHAKIMAEVSPKIAGIRRFGSAALDLAWVAAGRYDGYFEKDLYPWDWAAGILMVREAGGFVTDYRGGERAIERSEVVAGSSAIHSKLQKLVAGVIRQP